MHKTYRSITQPHPDIVKEQETIELVYLRKKMAFVNGIVFLMIAPTFWLLYQTQVSTQTMGVYGLLFTMYFIINIAFYAYEDYFNSLKLGMYGSTLILYVLVASLILEIQTPSIFTTLFLAYAIISLYQDKKIALMNSMLLLSIGSIFIGLYPHIFLSQGTTPSQQIYLYLFLIIFVSLLTAASYILIKRKVFFYRQLAIVKETEIRMINVIFDLQDKSHVKNTKPTEYYNKVFDFAEELSGKINMDNVFSEKLKIIDLMNQGAKKSTIISLYPSYNREALDELERLIFDKQSRLSYIAYKASQAANITISRRELYSETHLKTLKKTFDSSYTKIISFSALHTLLKLATPLNRALDEEEIKELLTQTDFYYLIDHKVLDVYLNNVDVFKKIHDDAFKEKVSS